MCKKGWTNSNLRWWEKLQCYNVFAQSGMKMSYMISHQWKIRIGNDLMLSSSFVTRFPLENSLPAVTVWVNSMVRATIGAWSQCSEFLRYIKINKGDGRRKPSEVEPLTTVIQLKEPQKFTTRRGILPAKTWTFMVKVLALLLAQWDPWPVLVEFRGKSHRVSLNFYIFILS